MKQALSRFSSFPDCTCYDDHIFFGTSNKGACRPNCPRTAGYTRAGSATRPRPLRTPREDPRAEPASAGARPPRVLRQPPLRRLCRQCLSSSSRRGTRRRRAAVHGARARARARFFSRHLRVVRRAVSEMRSRSLQVFRCHPRARSGPPASSGALQLAQRARDARVLLARLRRAAGRGCSTVQAAQGISFF